MTNEQYEKYKKKREELAPVKSFLFWCGDRYKNKTVGKHRFQIFTKCKEFFLHSDLDHIPTESNTYSLPKELQTRIVKAIEDYVDEVEKEMEEI